MEEPLRGIRPERRFGERPKRAENEQFPDHPNP